MSVGVATIYFPKELGDNDLYTRLYQIGVIVISIAGMIMVIAMMNILKLFSSSDEVTSKRITYAQYAVGAFYCLTNYGVYWALFKPSHADTSKGLPPDIFLYFLFVLFGLGYDAFHSIYTLRNLRKLKQKDPNMSKIFYVRTKYYIIVMIVLDCLCYIIYILGTIFTPPDTPGLNMLIVGSTLIETYPVLHYILVFYIIKNTKLMVFAHQNHKKQKNKSSKTPVADVQEPGISQNTQVVKPSIVAAKSQEPSNIFWN
jgi:hypothetical protein